MSDPVQVTHYDLGYAILQNGDIVTSDGLPRGNFDEQDWIEQFGKSPTYRKPTEAEAALWSGTNERLARAYDDFKNGVEQPPQNDRERRKAAHKARMKMKKELRK